MSLTQLTINRRNHVVFRASSGFFLSLRQLATVKSKILRIGSFDIVATGFGWFRAMPIKKGLAEEAKKLATAIVRKFRFGMLFEKVFDDGSYPAWAALNRRPVTERDLSLLSVRRGVSLPLMPVPFNFRAWEVASRRYATAPASLSSLQALAAKFGRK